MGNPLTEELVRRHQADRRAEAARWSLARPARTARARPAPRVPGRARTGLAGVLHMVAKRLEAGGTAVP